MLSLLLGSAALALPQSRAASAPVIRKDAAVPFRVGELLTYDISWSNTVSAGTATFQVQGRQTLPDGRSAYRIVAEAKPGWLISKLYTLYYKMETSLDTAALLPIQGVMYSEEGKRKVTKTTKFVSPTSVDYEIKINTPNRKTRTIERMSQDPLSLFYMLRINGLPTSTPVTIPLVESGEAYRVSVQANGREQLKTGAGTFPAIRATATILDAQGKPIANRKLTLWISDDARRLPLRLDSTLPVGSFVLSLSQITG